MRYLSLTILASIVMTVGCGAGDPSSQASEDLTDHPASSTSPFEPIGHLPGSLAASAGETALVPITGSFGDGFHAVGWLEPATHAIVTTDAPVGTKLTASPNGRWVAASAPEYVVDSAGPKLLDRRTGKVRPIALDASEVLTRFLSWSEDLALVEIKDGAGALRILGYDAAEGQVRWSLPVATPLTTVTPDGATFIAGVPDLALHRSSDGTKIADLADIGARKVVASPDSAYFVLGSVSPRTLVRVDGTRASLDAEDLTFVHGGKDIVARGKTLAWSLVHASDGAARPLAVPPGGSIRSAPTEDSVVICRSGGTCARALLDDHDRELPVPSFDSSPIVTRGADVSRIQSDGAPTRFVAIDQATGAQRDLYRAKTEAVGDVFVQLDAAAPAIAVARYPGTSITVVAGDGTRVGVLLGGPQPFSGAVTLSGLGWKDGVFYAIDYQRRKLVGISAGGCQRVEVAIPGTGMSPRATAVLNARGEIADIYVQNYTDSGGKQLWRFAAPTHPVKAEVCVGADAAEDPLAP